MIENSNYVGMVESLLSGTFPNWGHFYDRYAQCWMEWKINLAIFIFWTMAECIYNLYTKKQPIKIKKVVRKCSTLQERCGMLWKLFYSYSVFFCATFSFWDNVDFDACDLMDAKDFRIFLRNMPLTLTCDHIEARVLNPETCGAQGQPRWGGWGGISHMDKIHG